jgi:RHS repeat-associated core domain
LQEKGKASIDMRAYNAFGNERNRVVTDPNPFRYCGEYYDAELQEIYLRARSYDPTSGRFTQEDPSKDTDNWYAYTNNNPVMFKDPSGLAIYFVHGTFSNPERWEQGIKDEYCEIFNTEEVDETFRWNGLNTNESRQEAAINLANDIEEYARAHPGEPIIIVGHSHGGNVAILTTNILEDRGVYVEILVTLATPVRPEYQLRLGTVTQHIHVYSNADTVQIIGSFSLDGDEQTPLLFALGNLRQFPRAMNIETLFRPSAIDPYTGEMNFLNAHSLNKDLEVTQLVRNAVNSLKTDEPKYQSGGGATKATKISLVQNTAKGVALGLFGRMK